MIDRDKTQDLINSAINAAEDRNTVALATLLGMLVQAVLDVVEQLEIANENLEDR